MSMHCACGAPSTVTQTNGVERRRKCRTCGATWATVETRLQQRRRVRLIERIVDTIRANRAPMTPTELALILGTTPRSIAHTLRQYPHLVKRARIVDTTYQWDVV